MNSREKKKRSDAIKRLCFTGEDGLAYRLAEGIRNAREQGRDDEISMLIFGSSSPLRWRLVADAFEEKTRFHPTPTRLNIVAACEEADNRQIRAGRSPSGGVEVSTLLRGPTLREVKAAFVELFGEQKLPSDWTIRKTRRRLNLPLRRDKVGRPRNSQPK
jgi:hypothetical protein